MFVFSHGWNNDWDSATARYLRFFDQFAAIREAHWAQPGRRFDPLLVGIIWPSTALVAPWEQPPDIASAKPEQNQLAELTADLTPDDAERVREIARNPSPDEADVRELAELLAPAASGVVDETNASGTVAHEDLYEIWRAPEFEPAAASTEPGGFIDDATGGPVADPAAAGWNPFDIVRKAIRITTVLQMKDRAGRVGATGVADMVRQILNASEDTRLSLVGHSYGCRVMLSALAAGDAPRRPAESVLLLQAATSCYAFADEINGSPGGYRRALDRVRQPIITTHSSHDGPLTRFFHLVARRRSDIGDPVIAGGETSPFAALGGFGPRAVAAERLDLPAVGAAYPATGHRVIAADGSAFIKAHGAVETPETAWALLSQARA